MPITRTYLDWNQPLLPAVTRELLSTHSGQWMDLSSTLIIVPTVHSGRRLRETLALVAAEADRGLFPPRLLTPDTLLSHALKGQPIASEACVTAAWVSVLGVIDPKQFHALFPIEPAQTIGWQLGMAQRLMQLRNELGEEGLMIGDAAERAAEAGHEPERWRQLARLEGLYLDQLKLRKLIDPKQARRDAAANFKAPGDIERIILAATPDPQPLPLQALDCAAQTLPVEVWIYGPDEGLFDQWGRPVSDIWIQRNLQIEDWNCQPRTFTDLKSTASHLSQSLQGAKPESVLIGLAEPTLNPIVAESLNAAGIPSYDPEGQALHAGGIGRLTELLCQLTETPDTPTIRTLLQHPDIIQWLASEASVDGLLHRLDQAFEKHLAADLSALVQFNKEPHLDKALRALQRIEKSLRSHRNFPSALATSLQTIYADQAVPSGQAMAPWPEYAQAIRNLLDTASEANEQFNALPSEFARSAFTQSLKNAKVYPDRPKDAHDLLGWLELLWNDAPHLSLAGMNEGTVPESVVGDAFLPETLREQLGLRTNAQRFARDAYLLEALCRRRAEDGRIDILVPQAATDGTPLKPSRLLFQGGPETLLARTQKLFAKPSENHIHSTHTPAWKLQPPQGLKMPESLSVSSLKSYLECPFRFFLRHIMKMRTLDVETRELTPATFGTLFHDTVAHLKGFTLDHTVKQPDLVKKLHEIAEGELQHKYGKSLSFALRLQHEALMARIVAYCERQMEDVRDNGGTTIREAETDFNMVIEGVTIKGVIDRIDERNGHAELIDYKTADSPKTPKEAHLARIARKEPPAHLPDEARFEHEGKNHRWTDLQLPLYALSIKEADGERPRVAYFNLGKTLEKSGLSEWDDFTDSHLDSARECAAAVIRQIKAGIFWPPNPDVREAYDDFASLFPDGIENSVNADAFKNYRFLTE